MANSIPSSTTSSTSVEKMHEASNQGVANGDVKPTDRHSLDRVGSRNKSIKSDTTPEPTTAAATDIEKGNGEVPKPVVGGINPADFPDGGLEAWLVVLGGWCCLFCKYHSHMF